MKLEIQSPTALPDRGPYDIYPQGTKCRRFVVKDPATSTMVTVAVYFTPDGNQFFSFITPKLSHRMAYSIPEVQVMHSFMAWYDAHHAELAPTDQNPAGLPLDDIKDCEPIIKPTQGEKHAELGQ
jgi:hypothetical protein